MSVIADNDGDDKQYSDALPAPNVDPYADPVPAASASSALPAAPSLVTPPDERDTRTRDRSRSRSPGYRSRDVPPPRSNFRPDSRRHGATVSIVHLLPIHALLCAGSRAPFIETILELR